MIDSYQQATIDLVRAQTQSGQALKLRVISNSMTPLLRIGDGVIAQAVSAAELRIGDVLVAQHGGEMITHRLIDRQNDRLYLKGDSRRTGDAAIGIRSVVGRVIAIERTDRTIDLRQPRWARFNRSCAWLSRWHLQLLTAWRPIGYLFGLPYRVLIYLLYIFS